MRGRIAIAVAGVGAGAAESTVWGGWLVVAVVAVPVATVLVWLAWVLADAARTRRLTSLIRAARREGR